MTQALRPATLLLATAATSVALAGCKMDNRPLLARSQPAPDAYSNALPLPKTVDARYSQSVDDLPPQQAYAYPVRAYRTSRSYYQAQPTYAFAYEEERPWVWASADDGATWRQIASDLPDVMSVKAGSWSD